LIVPAQAPPSPTAGRRRTGRPPKRADVVPTRDRLVAASIDVFVERGFSQASVTEIAERAGISGPAVYKHFDGKADLLIEAAQRSLERMISPAPTTTRGPAEVARRWLADDFAPTRRLLLELHLAAGREIDLAALLADWHLERTRAWQEAHDDPVDRIKAFYLLLLGLAQLDALAALQAEPAMLAGHVDRMVAALFADHAEP
jgi:AcrR family transcriptional regulator